jgi:hypothetical protein
MVLHTPVLSRISPIASRPYSSINGSVNEIVIFPGGIGWWVQRASFSHSVAAATPNALDCPWGGGPVSLTRLVTGLRKALVKAGRIGGT